MMNTAESRAGFKGSSYEVFVLLLSLLAICNIFFFIFPAFSPDATAVVLVIAFFLSAVFFADFLYRLFTAESKVHYFGREGGWADLLSCIPYPGTKIFRLFRIYKTVTVMRKFSGKRVMDDFSEERASGTLFFVIFFIIIVIEISAIFVLAAERTAADANIRTAGDALWWAYVTTTTVGYGDQFPVTTKGRVVGFVLMAAGVSIFGTLAGFLSNKLTTPRKRRTEKNTPAESGRGEKGEDIRVLMDRQEKMLNEILIRLEKIEEVVRSEEGEDQ